MGYVVRSQYWLLYTTGVCAHVTECLSRRSGSWNHSWFQPGPATRLVGSSQLLFLQKMNSYNCSVWAVGTMTHLVLLVVSCWTKFEDALSGKCLGWMCLLFVFWGRKNVSAGRAVIDPLTVRYINVNLVASSIVYTCISDIDINMIWQFCAATIKTNILGRGNYFQ